MKLPAWAQRNNEGPPDLDEVFRDLNQKINNLFGKGGGKGNIPPSTNEPINLPILPIIVVILLAWLATGFYIVDQGSLGVKQRFGQYVESTEPGPRWHWPYPIETVTVVNMEQVRRLEVGYRSGTNGSKTKVPAEALMLTEDENIIDLQFAVQYNLKNAKDYLFNNRSTDESVMSVAETAIREVVGKNKLDDLLQKGLQDTSEQMQALLDFYKTGVNVTSVSLQAALPPEPVQEAFEDVNRANQDYQRQINEGEAYANAVVPKARGNAARLIAEADGYKLKVESEAKGNANRFERIYAEYVKAPEVTRKRLYLEAQEQILSSVSKVIIDQKEGGSLLYLPLDKLMQASETQGTSRNTTQSSASVASDKSAESIDVERALERSREREGN
ncbi:MAG: FtsH protease activity modulator HflK [Betaproteobacteria bacterium]|nr:FtsH protease activity modulator HflK [Betaproteobacteria bacterium]MCH9848739.1 FtsH protease activity modulator HflK [Betaproteobacteria bacterium]